MTEVSAQLSHSGVLGWIVGNLSEAQGCEEGQSTPSLEFSPGQALTGSIKVKKKHTKNASVAPVRSVQEPRGPGTSPLHLQVSQVAAAACRSMLHPLPGAPALPMVPQGLGDFPRYKYVRL